MLLYDVPWPTSRWAVPFQGRSEWTELACFQTWALPPTHSKTSIGCIQMVLPSGDLGTSIPVQSCWGFILQVGGGCCLPIVIQSWESIIACLQITFLAPDISAQGESYSPKQEIAAEQSVSHSPDLPTLHISTLPAHEIWLSCMAPPPWNLVARLVQLGPPCQFPWPTTVLCILVVGHERGTGRLQGWVAKTHQWFKRGLGLGQHHKLSYG